MRKQSLWESVREFLGFGRRETPRGLQALKCRTLHLEPLEQRQLLTVLYWDPDLNSANNNYSTGAGLGGSGTSNWSTTNAWVDSNGTRYTWNSGRSGDEAYFRGTAGTVTVDSAISAAKLNFLDADGYTLGSGSTLTLTGSGGTSINAAQSAAINAAVSVTTADQTWTVASGKTLSLGGSVSFASRALTINGTGTANFTGSVSGGSLAAVDWTTATFSGSSSLTTTSFTEVRGNGTINWNSSGTLSPTCLYVGYSGWAGTLTQISGTVAVNNANGVSISSTQSPGTKSTYNLDGGVLQTHVMVADSSSDTVFDFGGGTLQAAGGNLTPSTALQYTTTNGTTSAIDTNGNTVTLNGVIGAISGIADGSGNLTKNGSGTLTLSGSNTFTGTTRINAGTLTLNNALALQDSTLDLNSGDSGTLSFGTLTSATFGGLMGSRNLLLQNASSASVALTVGNNGNDTAYSGGMSGSGTVTKTGAGTLTLSGSNSPTGVYVSGGVMTFSAGNLTVGSVYVGYNTPGTLNWNSSGTLTAQWVLGAGYGAKGVISQSNGGLVAASTSLQWGLQFSGSQSEYDLTGGTLSVNNIASGYANCVLSFSGGTLQAAAALNVDTNLSYAISNGTTATVNTNGYNVALAGVISGGGALTKNGSGTLTLSGSNTFTGTTRINAGALTLNNALALQDSTLDLNSGDSGTLSFGTLTSATFGGLMGSRNLSLQNASSVSVALAVGNNNADTTYSGVLSGSGSLTKIGTGTLTLGGNNTYTGATAISQGTLSANSIVVTGGSSNLGNATSAVVLGDATHQGVLSYTGNSAAYVRGFTVASGEIDVTAGQTLTIGTTGISDSASLTIGGEGNTTISSVVSGSGGVYMMGTGTLTLSGDNTYTGDTMIDNGTISASKIVVRGGSSNLGNATSPVVLGDPFSGNGNGVLSYTGNSDNFTRGFTINLGGGEIDVTTSGQTLTIGTNGIDATGALTIGGAGNTTISSVISDMGSLTKAGAGMLTLSGTNTYTGTTTISQGTLSASNIVVGAGSSNLGNATSAVVLGDATHQGVLSYTGNTASYARGFTVGAGGGELDVTTAGQTLTVWTNGIAAGGALTIGGAGNSSISSAISGTGSLTKAGTGTLTLSGLNTYSGTTTIGQGTVVASKIVVSGGSSNLGNATSAVVLGDATYQGILSYTDSAATYTRGFTVNAGGGEIDVTTAGQMLTVGTNGISAGGVLTIGGAGDMTISSVISGTGSLTKTGTGTLTLSGANTYTGATTISQGTLSANSIVVSGGSSNLGNATSAVVLGDATHQGVLSYTDSTATYTRGFTVNAGGGEIDATTAGQTLTVGTSGVSAGGALTIGGAGNVSISSVISGTGSLTKTGAGTLTLSGANTYTGTTTVSVGTLQESGGSNRLPTGTAVSLANASGAVLDLNGQSQTVASLSGGGASGGNVTLGAGTLTVGDSSSTTFAGVLSGTGGSLVKQGSGTLTLSGANTYTGTTTVSVGTLQESGGSNRLPTGTAVSLANASGAVLDLNGQSQTVASLSGGGASGGNVTLGAGTLTVGDSSSTTFAGVLSGTGGSLVKQGSGTLTLSGANTYTGTTTVSVGTLQESGGSNRLPTGTAVSLANASGAVLDLNGQSQTVASLSGGGASGGNVTLGAGTLTVGDSSSTTFAGVLSGTGGSLVKQGSGTLTLSGANTYTGTTTVSVGTLQESGGSNRLPTGTAVSLANASGAVLDLNGQSQTVASLSGGGASGGNVTLGAGTLTVGDSSSTTFAGVLSGTGGSLVKQGSGTLTLSGANTYTGTTTVSVGTLQESGGSNRLPTGTAVSLANASGAVLDLNGQSQTVASLSGGGASGGNVTLGAGTLTVGDSSSTTFAGVLSGTGGSLVKQGSGTLTLSGANTYTGTTTVSVGTLQESGGSNRLPTGTAVSLANASGAVLDLNGQSQTVASLSGGGASGGNVTLGAGTLTVGDSSSTTFAGVLSGTGGSLVKQGSGTLTLSGANTYTGTTTVSVGTLQESGGSNRLPTGTAVSLANASGAVLDLNGQSQTVASLSGGGASGGNVTLGAGTLTVGDSSSTTFAGVLSGTGGSLVKQGSGTLTLSGANTYTGTTTVSVGTLQESGGSNRLPTGTAVSLANASGAVLDLNGQSQTVASLSGGGASGGNVTLGAGTLTVGDSSSTTFAGVLSGTGGSLVKQGSGTLTLSGANTYTGTTTVSVGTLQESGGSNRLPTGTAVSLANASGAVLDLNGQSQTVASLSGGGASGGNVTLGAGTLTVGDSSSTTFAGVLSGTGGSLVKQGSGTLTLSGANTYTGTTTVSVGTLQESGGSNRLPTGTAVSLANASGAVLDLNGQSQTVASLSGGGASGGNVTLGAGTLTVGDSSSTTFAGVLSGTGGSLVKQGSGTLTLSGANTYTGTTTVSVGTLQESGGSNRLPTGTAVSLANASGAVLDLNGQSQTVASLSGGGASGGNVTLGAGTLTVGDSSSTTFAGVLSGTGGSLVKQGSGTLTLSGANTYTGTTTVSVGTLQESGGSNRLPTGTAVSLANASGAVLDLNGQSQTVASLSGGGASGGNVTLGAGTLTVGDSSSTTFAGVLSGTGGSLVKQGSGTLTLSGANTYTGTTTVSVGTLQESGGSNRLPTGTAVSLANASGAVLDLNGQSQTVASLSGGGASGGNVTLGAGTLTVGDSSSTTFAGVLSGTGGSLVKQGSGTLTLSGANTYTGTTTVSVGTLQESGGSNRLPTGTAVSLANASGAVLDLNGQSQTVASLSGGGASGGNVTLGAGTLTVGDSSSTTFAGVLSGTGGSLVKQGSGTLTLSGANTYTGTTTVSVGTLQESGGSNRLPTGTAVSLANASGAVLDLNGQSQTVASLSGGGASGGNVTLGAGTLTVGDSSSTTFAGVLSGTGGSLVKQGSGTLTLSGANTYTGTTTVSVGTLQESGGSNRLPTGTAVSLANASGAVLDLNGQSQTIASLSGGGASGGNVTLGAGTLTVGDSSSTTFAGVLSGTGGSLVKQGSGTLTLSGANTYTGTTTVSVGTLQVGAGGTAGTLGTGSVTDSSALVFNRSDSLTEGSAISGTGTLTQQGTGTLILTGANTYSGTTTISQGTISVSNIVVSGGGSNLGNATSAVVLGDATHQGVLSYTDSTATYTRGFTVNAGGGEIDVTTAGQTLTIGTNGVSGSGSLTIGGAGSTLMSAANSYSGNTIISAGTLQVGNVSAIPSGTGKGNVTVNGTLDLNGNSITINGLSGSGTVTSGVAGSVTLTVGANDQTSTFWGVVQNGSGTVGLTKIGSGTLTLATNQTYSGPTTVEAGTLNVLGNLNSDVTLAGGAVTGLVFYDHDLAAAVREALGMSADTVLTTSNVAALTSLSADSNRISTLEGLEYATKLESLTLVPGDFSPNSSYEHLPNSSSNTSPLAPLAGLTHLTTLSLQDCGLNNTALTTSVNLPALQSLDLRYNDIGAIPSWIASLSNLTSLLVYGNSALANDPRTGLLNLKGKLINVDLAPDNPEKATTIADLAASLYYLPVEMYEYVVNTIEFQPYAGAMKGALAVLQTGTGNDWDTDSLLVGLLAAIPGMSITTNYVSGQITVSDETAENYVGVTETDASAAVAVLDAAGLDPTTGTGTITFDHTWLEATFGSTTVKLDPAWKFRDFQEGLGDMLDVQSFDANDYLSTVKTETAAEYYEQKVRDYLAANDPSKTIADVPYAGPIHPQVIDSLPTTLPFDGIAGTFTVNGSYSSGETTLTASSAVFSSDLVGHAKVRIELLSGTSEFAITDFISPTQVIVQGDATCSARDSFLVSTIVPTTCQHQVQISVAEPWWGVDENDYLLMANVQTDYDSVTDTTRLTGLAFYYEGSPIGDTPVAYLNFDSALVGTPILLDLSDTGTGAYETFTIQGFQWTNYGGNWIGTVTIAGNEARDHYCPFLYSTISQTYNTPDVSLDRISIGYTDNPGDITTLTPNLYVTTVNGEAAYPTQVGGAEPAFSPYDPYAPCPIYIVLGYTPPTTPVPNPGSAAKAYVTAYPRYVGDDIAIGLDAGQISDQWIVAARNSLNDAEIAKADNPSSTTQDASIIRGLLSLGVADYFHQTDQEEAVIDGLTGAVPVYNFVASCVASSSSTLQTADFNQQLPYVPGSVAIDVQNDFFDALPIGNSDPSAVARFNLLGYTDSAAESALWEELTNIPSISTIKSLQYANQHGITIATINPGTSLAAIKAALVGLDDDFCDSVSQWIYDSYTSKGYKVYVPDHLTPVGGWMGVGLTVVEVGGNEDGEVVGYMIYGGAAAKSQYAAMSGGEAVGPPNAVTTIVSADASLLVSDPVNAANGDVVHQETDFSIPNLGVPLDFARQYDSFNTVAAGGTVWSDRGMGEGWSFSFSDKLIFNYTSGVLTSVTWFTANGVRNTFALDGSAYVTPAGLFGAFAYNSTGQYYTWTDSSGNVVKFDQYGRLTDEYDRYDNGVHVTYDGNTTHIATVYDRNDSSRCLTFTYNNDSPTAHIITITDFSTPANRTWSYSYTGGRLTSVTANYSSPGVYDPDYPDQNVKTSYTYYTDPALAGLLETVTDADNNTTTYEYYANRRGFKVTDPEGGVYSLSYNLFRQQTAATCKLGSTGYYSYEVDGGIAYLTERLYADQTTNTYQWSGGLLTSDTDAYGQTETYTYYNDGTGDLHTYTDQASNVTTYTYIGDIQDRNLNIASITAPGPNGNVVTTFTYYANSGKSLTDITEDSGGLNVQTTFTYQGTYGARGLPDSMTTPNGYTTTYTYNSDGQVWTESYPVSSTHSIEESYTYDARGNVLTATDGNGNITTYTYDLLDRVKTETDPDPDGAGYGLPAPYFTYTYDAAGNLLSETDDTVPADPRATSYAYDNLGQVTSVTNPDGTYTTYDYDQGGNQVFQTDELGRLTQYVYDQRYRLIDTIQPDGGVLRTTYDGGNRVVAETDALGNTTQYEYDLLGQLTEVVSPDPDGAGTLTSLITLYGYDAAGNLQYVTNTYAVDSDNTPAVSLGNPDHSTQYVYDSLGRVTEEIDAKPDANTAGPTTYYGYDNDGNLKWVTDARGSAAQDPDHTTTYDYDQADRLIHVNVPDPNGSTGEKLTTRYFYDDDGNVTDVVDPRGTDAKEAAYTTHYVYDNLGRLTEEVDPDPDDFSHAGGSNGPETRPTTTYAYDAYGNLATVTDPMGYHTTYQYDKLGQCTAVTDPLGNTSSVLYDAVGNVLLATDALGAVTSYQYDSMDQVVQVTQPAPDANTPAPVTYYGYDADGNLAWSTDPEGSGPQDPDHTTTYAYDNLGRQILVTGPDTGSNTPATSYAYDALGNLHSVTDGLALGHATTYAYDNLGRLTSQTDALSGVTSYTYDPNGNTLSVEDPDGNTTQYAYDSLNRLTSETDQLADTRYYQYDAVGDLTQYTDRDGRVTQYQYDNLGRETAENWLDSNQNVIHTFSYGYDADGDLLVASDPAAWYSYAYNDDGQLATETQTIAGLTPVVMLSRQYDAVGDLTQLAASLDSTGDFVNDYLHNWLGEVTSIEQHGVVGGDSIAEKRVDFTYNALGQFSTIARYSALAGGSGNEVATSTYGYDNAGRLTSLTDTHGTTTLAGYQFQYDAADNLTEMKSSADATTGNSWGVVDYTYDHTNQLQTATYTTFANAPANENYGYDANGNQDTSGNTVQPTGDNRLATDAAGYTYFYDAEGNRTAKFIGTPTDDHTIPSDATDITIYHWDYRDRLTEVDHFATFVAYSGETSDKVVTYAYDFANRLVKEIVDTDGSSGSTPVQQTVYAYDGMNAVLQFEKTGTGNLAASNLSDRYLWGAAVDQILADEQVTSLGTPGTPLWGLADHEGTIRDIVNNSGSVIDHRVFDSFGKMTSTPAVDFDIGYAGMFYDSGSQMNRTLFRLYDPSIGRWANQDPLGLAAGPNPYAYCGNGPMTSVDPLGLWPQSGEPWTVDTPEGRAWQAEGPGGAAGYQIGGVFGHVINGHFVPDGHNLTVAFYHAWGKGVGPGQFDDEGKPVSGFDEFCKWVADSGFAFPVFDITEGGSPLTVGGNSPLEQVANILKNIAAQGGSVGVVYLDDHGIMGGGQLFGHHGIDILPDKNGNLSPDANRNLAALRKIGSAMKPNGLILMGGCTAGNEAFLIQAAQASGQRVRGCIGWAKGFEVDRWHPGLWAEADKNGTITYYDTGDPNAKPKYTKVRTNANSASGVFIIHGDNHKYRWKDTKEGVVIYDDSGIPMYIQGPRGELKPYFGKPSGNGSGTKGTGTKPGKPDQSKCY